MPRLATSLLSDRGEVCVELQFGIDDQGIDFVAGKIDAELQVSCQRCLEPMSIPVRTDIALALAGSEAAANRLSGPYDPLVVPSTPLRLAPLIEDELILSLPMTPRHPPDACGAKPAGDPKHAASHRDSPFAALASWHRRERR